jgi:hypothetical protein
MNPAWVTAARPAPRGDIVPDRAEHRRATAALAGDLHPDQAKNRSISGIASTPAAAP